MPKYDVSHNTGSPRHGVKLGGLRRRSVRRTPARSFVRPLILSVVLAGASWLGVDGPVFVAKDAVPLTRAPHADLEKRFAALLDDTEVVVVDTQAVIGRVAVERYVAGRLNERGVFLSAAWDTMIEEVSDPAYGARAVWRRFLGGAHGSGLFGYFTTTGICLVTIGSEGKTLAAETNGSAAFWSRVVLVHELQHCVDIDRGNVTSPGTMATATAASHPANHDDRGTPWISGRELYADAATALFLVRDGVSADDIDRFARWRARPVVDALIHGRRPVWTHFTAPMLAKLAEDVRAGRLHPPRLSDQEIHTHALTYRDRSQAAATEVSLAHIYAGLQNKPADPSTLLRQAGAPAHWRFPIPDY